MQFLFCPRCGFSPLEGAACPRCGFAGTITGPAAPAAPKAPADPSRAAAAPSTVFFHPGAIGPLPSPGADSAPPAGVAPPRAVSAWSPPAAPPSPHAPHPLSGDAPMTLFDEISPEQLRALAAAGVTKAPQPQPPQPPPPPQPAAPQGFGPLGPVSMANRPGGGLGAPIVAGGLSTSGASWGEGGALLGANAMMPPDEEEELAMAKSRSSSAQSPGAAPSAPQTSSPTTQAAPAEPQAPSLNASQPRLARPSTAPSPRAPSDEDLGHAATMAVAAVSAPDPAAISGVRRRQSGANMSAPIAPVSMESIPLATEIAPMPMNPQVALDLNDRGEHCKKCGTKVYASMLRCPNCYEPYKGDKSSSRRIVVLESDLPSPRRRLGKLVLGIVVTAAVLTGAGFAIHHFSTAKTLGAPSPEDAVRGFFEGLFDRRFKASLLFLHENQRDAAGEMLAALEKSGVPPEKIVAQVVRAAGVGRIDVVVEKVVTSSGGGDEAKVEVLFRRDSWPMRRATLPLRREGQRWFLEITAFGGVP